MKGFSNNQVTAILGLLAVILLWGGNALAAPGDSISKRLPWTTGEKWNLTSGYNEDHHIYPPTQYKIDYAKRFNDLTPNQPGTMNQPVLAISAGVIEVVQTTDPWPLLPFPKPNPPELSQESLGKFIVINHGDGWYTQYDHLNSISITPGDIVVSGQELGRSGKSGFSIGYHIQTSLWKDGWHFSFPVGTPMIMEASSPVFGLDVNISQSPIINFNDTTTHFYIAEDEVVAPPGPGAPTLTNVVASDCSAITLFWTDVSGETGYEVFRDGSSVATLVADTISHNDTGLNADISYAYYIEALYGALGPERSNALSTRTPRCGDPDFDPTVASQLNKVLGSLEQSDYLAVDDQDLGYMHEALSADEPINSATGNFYTTVVDLEVVTPGDAITLARTYNSADTRTTGPLGLGWSFSQEERLIRVDDDRYLVKNADSTSDEFGVEVTIIPPPPLCTGICEPTIVIDLLPIGNENVASMTYDQATRSFSYSHPSGVKKEFNPEGYITKSTDRAGRVTSYSYSGNLLTSITDSVGRLYNLAYSNSKLVSITDPEGRSVQYSYDLSGRLDKVIDLRGKITDYDVEPSTGRVIRIRDPRGKAMRIEYDGDKASKITHADGGSTRLEYIGDTTTQTDELGNTLVYVHDANNRLISMTDELGLMEKYTYDSGDNRVSYKDRRGNTTLFEYDANNNLTRKEKPNGYVETRTYGPYNLPLTVTDPSGTMSLAYDGGGNLLRVTDRNSKSTTFTSTSLGLPKTITDPESASITIDYDAHGNAVGITDPLGNKSTYTFDGVSRNTGIKDAESHAVTLEFDPASNVTKIVDARLAEIKTSYDDSGNIISQTNEDGDSRYYTYTNTGMLESYTDYDGKVWLYTYDLNQSLLTEEDPEGNKTTHTYDVANRRISTKLPEGGVTTYEYDSNDNVIKIVDPEGNESKFAYNSTDALISVTDGMNKTMTMTRDKQDRLTSIKDFNSNTRKFTYDSLDKLKTEETPIGGTLLYSYDNNSKLLSIKDPLSRITEYRYDASRQLRELEDALGGITKYEYNRTGKLIKKIDANGNDTLYEYDPNGNLAKLTDAKGKATHFTYTPWNLLESVTDARNETVQFGYDKNGRLASTVDARGYGREYKYDTIGNLISSSDELGATSAMIYDNNYRIVKAVDPDGHQSHFAYDLAGNLRESTDARGYKTHFTYDKNNRIETVTDALGNVTTISYDGNSNIKSITDALGRETSFDYNGLNQKVSINNALGDSSMVTYDIAGQLESNTDFRGNRSYYNQDKLGRTISIVDANNHETKFEYDPVGNLLAQVSADTGRSTITYDEVNRVASKLSAEGIEERYVYDAIGNLLQHTDGEGGTTDYTYDQNSNLTKVTDPLRNATKYTYDPRNLLLTITDASDHLTKLAYDKEHRLVSLTNPLGDTKTYGYDENNNVISQTDFRGNTKTFAYDELNRLATYTDEELFAETYDYDKVHNLTKVVNRRGFETKYSYDDLNRVKSIFDAKNATETYTYDEDGNMRSLTDRDNKTTFYEYDAISNLTKEIDALNGVTRYTYDPVDRIKSQTNEKNQVDSMEYDLMGRLTVKTNAEGDDTLYKYNNRSEAVVVTNPRGYTNKYIYDAVGNVLEDIDGVGNSEHFVYDNVYNLTKQIDRRGNESEYVYDANDRLIEKVDELNFKTTYKYDKNANLLKVTDARNNDWNREYNPRNLLVSYAIPEGNTERYAYDENENLVKWTKAKGNVHTYEYDELDLLVKHTDPLSNETVSEYDSVERVVARLDANNNTTSYSYDPLHRLTKVTDAMLEDTAYGYDLVDNLISIVDANNHKTEFTYDVMNRLVNETNPMGKVWDYSYDLNSNLARRTDANGDTTRYTYDGNDRLIDIVYPEALHDVAYEYDPNGNLSSMSDRAGNSAYTYDARNMLSNQEDARKVTAEYSYDGNMNRISTRYPNGLAQTLAYDKNNDLVSSSDWQNLVASFDYDLNRNLVKETYPNETNVTYAYDNDDRLTKKQNSRPGEVFEQYDMTYDGVDNIVKEVRAYSGQRARGPVESKLNTIDYAYDNNYRLIGVSDTDAHVASYAYDAVGNRTQEVNNRHLDVIRNGKGNFDSNSPVTVDYTYDSANRLLNDSLYSYAYDNNGSRITKTTNGGGENIDYAYDFDNRLMAADVYDKGPNPDKTRYIYDGLGRRVQKHTTGQNVNDEINDVKAKVNRPEECNECGGSPIEDEPAEEPSKSAKVTVCHIGNELEINKSALTAHLEHGDTEGVCVVVAEEEPVIEEEQVVEEEPVATSTDPLGEVLGDSTVNTEDQAEAESPNAKVSVCHNAGTIEIDESALPAHLEHGDTEGACPSSAGGGGGSGSGGSGGSSEQNSTNFKTKIDPDEFMPTWYVFDQFSYDPIAELGAPNKEIHLRRVGSRLYSKEIFSGAVPTPGDSVSEEGRYAYFYTTPRGDVSSLLKHNANSLHSYMYGEFGRVYDNNPGQGGSIGVGRQDSSNFTLPHNDYTRLGKEYDTETGLNYYGARYLDTSSGNWATQDIVRGSLEEPMSQNRYAYVHNNPIKFIDQYGYSASDGLSTQWGSSPTLDFTSLVGFSSSKTPGASFGFDDFSHNLKKPKSSISVSGGTGPGYVGNFEISGAPYGGSLFDPSTVIPTTQASSKLSSDVYKSLNELKQAKTVLNTHLPKPTERDKIRNASIVLLRNDAAFQANMAGLMADQLAQHQQFLDDDGSNFLFRDGREKVVVRLNRNMDVMNSNFDREVERLKRENETSPWYTRWKNNASIVLAGAGQTIVNTAVGIGNFIAIEDTTSNIAGGVKMLATDSDARWALYDNTVDSISKCADSSADLGKCSGNAIGAVIEAVATGGSTRVAKTADTASDVIRVVDKTSDITKTATKLDDVVDVNRFSTLTPNVKKAHIDDIGQYFTNDVRKMSTDDLFPRENPLQTDVEDIQGFMIRNEGFDSDYPILYHEIDGKKYIVNGHHRYEAAKKLGYDVYAVEVGDEYFDFAWQANRDDFIQNVMGYENKN